MATEKREPVESKTERINMRMYPSDFEFLTYWSDRYDMDRSEFLMTAMRHYVKHRNQDYDLPTAEIQRLNQMIDAVQNLAQNQASLQTTIVNGFDALMGLARGDNYLNDKEDGEL